MLEHGRRDCRVPAGGGTGCRSRLVSRRTSPKPSSRGPSPEIELVREESRLDSPDGILHHRHRTADVARPCRQDLAAMVLRPGVPLFLRRNRADRRGRLDRSWTKTFRASRYDKGGDDYINCPIDPRGVLARSSTSTARRGEGADAQELRKAASTSKAACRWRRWRGAGADTLAYRTDEAGGPLRSAQSGQSLARRRATAPGRQPKPRSTTWSASRRR